MKLNSNPNIFSIQDKRFTFVLNCMLPSIANPIVPEVATLILASTKLFKPEVLLLDVT